MRRSRLVGYWAIALLLVSAMAGAAPTTQPTTRRVVRTADSAVTPVDRNPKRHAGFMAIAAKGNIDLLFVGDSITDHWPHVGPDTWGKYAHFNPADFGVSGERTEDVLWRLTNGELDNIHPKVVVMMIGTNNLPAGDKAEWIAAGVSKLVETIREKLPDSKILLLAIFPRNNPKDKPDFMDRIVAANAIIAKLDDGQHVFYLDIGAKFLGADGTVPVEIMKDGLHPTAAGYQIWYDAMEAKLEELMK
jgi:lysophospholipase L1-like esterase